jgi:hypothetical protein
MNFRRALVISLLACLACFIPQSARAGEGQLVSSTVRSAALDGNLLGDAADRSVIVYLPPSYEAHLQSDIRSCICCMGTISATPCGRTGGFKD